MKKFCNLIRSENSNYLLPVSITSDDRFYAEHCFSPDGLKDNINEYSIDYDGFETEEERDNYISNTLLISNTMDYDITIARNIFFDDNLEVGDFKNFFVKEEFTRKNYGKGDCIITAIKGVNQTIFLLIFQNCDKKNFIYDGYRKDYIDFLTFNCEDEVFNSNFKISFC